MMRKAVLEIHSKHDAAVCTALEYKISIQADYSN